MSLNYFLLCSTSRCKEWKNFQRSLDSYGDNGNCLLKDIENRECAFLCKNCRKTSFINFEVIMNSETLKFIIRIEIEKKCYKLLDELNKFELNQLHFLKLFVEFCYI